MVVFYNFVSGIFMVFLLIDLCCLVELDFVKVVDYLRRYCVILFSGVSVFMEGLCDYFIDCGDVFEDIVRVLVGGGFVSVVFFCKVLVSFLNARDEAWGVYGLTEVEPIVHVVMTYMIVSENACEGFLVGYFVEEVEVCLFMFMKGVICIVIMEELEVLVIMIFGEVGEIVVVGVYVVLCYLDDFCVDVFNKFYFS